MITLIRLLVLVSMIIGLIASVSGQQKLKRECIKRFSHKHENDTTLKINTSLLLIGDRTLVIEDRVFYAANLEERLFGGSYHIKLSRNERMILNMRDDYAVITKKKKVVARYFCKL